MKPTEPIHIHEYNRRKGSKTIYRCVHPRCTHYWDKDSLLGKEALCTICKKPFILDRQQLKNAKPRCDFCSNSNKGKEARRARDEAQKLFGPEATEETKDSGFTQL